MSDPSSKPDHLETHPPCGSSCLLLTPLALTAAERAALDGAANPVHVPGGGSPAGTSRPQQEALAHALSRRALNDRISALSVLAGGLAHELNNPLAYVTANVSFLAEKASRVVELLAGAPHTAEDVELATQLGEAIRETRTGTDRMRAVVRDLATFAQPGEGAPRPVDLRPILDSCLNVAWSEIHRRRARLVRDLEPLAPVLAEPGRMSQVFLNLVLNAAQAIPEGDGGEHEIRVVGRTLPDGRVAVEVADTGAGIPPDHLPRIFDPFFTTKAPGGGTGLGLSICHAVVTALGGAIEVETAIGKGSRFRVLLPALGAEAARAAGLPTPVPAARRARVLVVDDEPLVGSMLRRTLAGHEVTTVQAAGAALDRLLGGDTFDVILADLIMPGMSGMELYRTATALQPGLAPRFVFLTGGATTPDARAFLDSGEVEWLEKPFDVDALRAAVARRAAATGGVTTSTSTPTPTATPTSTPTPTAAPTASSTATPTSTSTAAPDPTSTAASAEPARPERSRRGAAAESKGDPPSPTPIPSLRASPRASASA